MKNKLWQCPVKVKKGTFEEMPDSWAGALVNYYIGAPTHEEALTKAVTVIQSQGMEFVELLDNKVIQLDADQWWEGYVMANYAEYKDYFPDQDAVIEIVTDGTVFHGPFAGWESD